MKVIYTAGVWDLLHRGHLNILWESRRLGDMLVVGVVSDQGTEAYKGERPIQHETHRMRMLEQLPCVDLVVRQEGTDPSEVLDRIRPDVMTHGDDWPQLQQGHETLERLEIEWKLIPYTPGISSTALRADLTK
jgi:D-beta-D-heptose 7-phosphate kinase/D-beta-D-heptose 1-phosphate adenosyltransferase